MTSVAAQRCRFGANSLAHSLIALKKGPLTAKFLSFFFKDGIRSYDLECPGSILGLRYLLYALKIFLAGDLSLPTQNQISR
jgi:hypothetical protein